MALQSRKQKLIILKADRPVIYTEPENVRPKFSDTENLFNRIFGNGKVEIRPTG